MHQAVEGRECEGVVFPDQRGEGFLLLHLPLPLPRLAVALPTLVVAGGVLRWIHLACITSPLSGAESVRWPLVTLGYLLPATARLAREPLALVSSADLGRIVAPTLLI